MTDKPCWREATVRVCDGSVYCPEHARLTELAWELNGLELAKDITEEWLRVAEAWYLDGLISLPQTPHDEAVQEMVRMYAKVELAH